MAQESMRAEVLTTNRFRRCAFPHAPAAVPRRTVTRCGGPLAANITEPAQPVVKQHDDAYEGGAEVRLTESGTTPVTVAGGAVSVKNKTLVRFASSLPSGEHTHS
jgi:hypothetical protein